MLYWYLLQEQPAGPWRCRRWCQTHQSSERKNTEGKSRAPSWNLVLKYFISLIETEGNQYTRASCLVRGCCVFVKRGLGWNITTRGWCGSQLWAYSIFRLMLVSARKKLLIHSVNFCSPVRRVRWHFSVPPLTYTSLCLNVMAHQRMQDLPLFPFSQFLSTTFFCRLW